jgi:hypothetical protein
VNTTRRARSAGFLLAGSALALSTAGCSSEADNARRTALSRLREQADQIQTFAAHEAPKASSATELVAVVKANQPHVFATYVQDDEARWDAVLVAAGSDGGGLLHEQVALRACVRFATQLAGERKVSWTSLSCPPEADRIKSFGPWDQTITLEP